MMQLRTLLVSMLFLVGCVQSVPETAPEQPSIESYDPKIDPSDFVEDVTNPYFTLTRGTTRVYEGATEEGMERIEVTVTNDTKTVLGVSTIVVWDRVWLNDELIEDTKDWYAQDKDGNVWYFGEDTKELLGGKVVSYHGAWEAGVDNAKPGIIMKSAPQVGDSYRQEYYQGIAEDMADVLALGETVTVPYGTFTDCLKTRDWTPLEPGADEHKYYCAGGVALEIGVENGERVELISIRSGTPTVTPSAPVEELKKPVTEEEAKAIALKRVPGKVTDIAIERKYGKVAYVVEVDADNGPETDVIIDIDTGEILGVET